MTQTTKKYGQRAHRVRVIYKLACKHDILSSNTRFTTTADQKTGFYCVPCRRDVAIIGVKVREWHVRCTQCSMGRWMGDDGSGAIRLATKHEHETGHTVVMTYDPYPPAVKELTRLLNIGILTHAQAHKSS